MTPTVGRIVHYTNLGDAEGRFPPERQAALITKVVPRRGTVASVGNEDDYRVSLRVFYETGDFWMMDVPFSKESKRGHWSWPVLA